jgi:hypothetical protein
MYAIQNYQHDNKNLQTISHNPVNAVYEDNSGNLWVGTVEGGLNKKAVGSDSFIHYTYESGTLTHNSAPFFIPIPKKPSLSNPVCLCGCPAYAKRT